MFLFSSLFLLSANPSFAFYSTTQPDCSTIDLRNDFPLKMRNQGGISWCYAHAASDYLQFYNRIPDQISAADIAINYNHRIWPRFLRWLQRGAVPETGFIRSAIWDILPVGYCPEEYFPSDSWVKRIMTGEHAGEAVNVPLGKALEEITAMIDAVSKGIYLTPQDLPFVYEFKDVNHQQFYDALFTNPSGTVLDELRSVACDSHRKEFPKTITDIRMIFRGRNTFTLINSVLDQHSAVTVDFFYGFLNNIDSYKKQLSELHTTVMMGRRFNSESQECQYLIKNSYGTDCTGYDPRHQCENGNIWVSESALFGAMTSFVYIADSENNVTGIAPQTQDGPDFRSRSIAH